MDELYGIHSTGTNVYPMAQLPESMVAPASDYLGFQPPIAATFPVYGSEQFFSGSSVSDAASMAAGMQRGGGGGGGYSEEEVSSAIRAKIASHPLYPKLLQAYIDCQKVGAPPEIAYLLDEIRQQTDFSKKSNVVVSSLGVDPELDEFMETYCDILMKYKADLSKPFDEATTFLNDIEAQFNSLCNETTTQISKREREEEEEEEVHVQPHVWNSGCFHGQFSHFGSGWSRTWTVEEHLFSFLLFAAETKVSAVPRETVGSSDEDGSGGEVEVQDSARAHEDREIKDKLLRKYSGYISTLKHEFSKKKKKGKLPKDSRQILLNWWNIHYKWPYPTEADKAALAGTTGLDQKQINNWFINQRKRHWKPSEDMQFAVVDSIYGPYFMRE
ncbi:hypothetical protein Tsubulata_002947 [Turnera subulata]|uniref:Homeobox domain-containing protein n=1 Tax=Turnera subulata TaxID=218843 RepID=A0A9Q0JEW9_9ROSI|nr:hypothetical protein Tsubulata_002947 [Turnera subulata]